MDYGSVFYAQAAQCHLNKINIIQNKCLRLTLGALRSTPINNLLSECNELPLNYRRRILCKNFVIRLIEKDSPLCNLLHELFILDLTSQYWTKKKSLLIIDCYQEILPEIDNIFKSNLNCIHQVNISDENFSINCSYLRDYSKFPPKLRNLIFVSDMEEKWPNSYKIYTDGSKIENSTACAFYDPQQHTKKQFKLLQQFSIYSAELVAILEAIKYVINLNLNNVVIVTDSKSSVDKLSNININSKINYLIRDIIKELQVACNNNCKITIIWIKAHCGIIGNETVDNLAKSANNLASISNYKYISTDIAKYYKNKTLNLWQEEYKNTQKGLYYKNFKKNPNGKSWFSKITYTGKNFIKTLCRMRFNHGYFPYHMHKINLTENPNCICGEPGSLEHIILDCNVNQQYKILLLNKLGSLNNIEKPFNLVTLLISENEEVYLLLYQFIVKTKLRI